MLHSEKKGFLKSLKPLLQQERIDCYQLATSEVGKTLLAFPKSIFPFHLRATVKAKLSSNVMLVA